MPKLKHVLKQSLISADITVANNIIMAAEDLQTCTNVHVIQELLVISFTCKLSIHQKANDNV